MAGEKQEIGPYIVTSEIVGEYSTCLANVQSVFYQVRSGHDKSQAFCVGVGR